jgi:hypothetical protein
MGSFNTTCFVTQQTIAGEDKCYVLPVRQAIGYSPVKLRRMGEDFSRYGICHQDCYPNANWEPVGNFLEGEYDDYGLVELANTPLNHHRLTSFFRYLQNYSFVAEPGENYIHDVPFDFPAFVDAEPELQELLRGAGPEDQKSRHELLMKAWAYYEEVSRQYRVFTASHGEREPRQVRHAILHKDAYLRLIALTESQQGYKGQPYTRRAVFDRILDEVKGLADKTQPKLASMYWGLKLSLVGFSSGLSFDDEDDVFEPLFERYIEGQMKKDALFKAVRPWLDSRFVMMGLNQLNIRISPMTYATQDYSNEIGRLYAAFVSEACAVITANRAMDDE